jgi:hypothetical protein
LNKGGTKKCDDGHLPSQKPHQNAQAHLLTYRSKYTFDGVEYAPLMYKVIMRLATIDTVATTQTLQDNLQNLGVFAATVSSDINKIHGSSIKTTLNSLPMVPPSTTPLASSLMPILLSRAST